MKTIVSGKKVVTDPGDSQTLQAGQNVTVRSLVDEIDAKTSRLEIG